MKRKNRVYKLVVGINENKREYKCQHQNVHF